MITDDPPLLDFLSGLLRQHRCIRDGAVTEEDRGAMAGVPLASFFANVYLMDLDRLFLEKGIPYFRYSDDLILFFPDSAQLEENLARIRGILDNKRLTLNEEKFSVSGPGESWEYLGFVYCGHGSENEEQDPPQGACALALAEAERGFLRACRQSDDPFL